MRGSRVTERGVGGVGPARSLAHVDWTTDVPPALVALRRDELVALRRSAAFRVLGAAMLIGFGATVFVLGWPRALGTCGLVVWGVIGLVPAIRELRGVWGTIAELDRRPRLPVARVLTVGTVDRK